MRPIAIQSAESIAQAIRAKRLPQADDLDEAEELAGPEGDPLAEDDLDLAPDPAQDDPTAKLKARLRKIIGS